MRTQEEIIQRIKDRSPQDFFGFEIDDYFRALSKESLESLRGDIVKEDANLSEFQPDLINDDAILKQCRDYMDFAWDKANSGRGISASRSMSHYKAWLWMLGEDQFEDIDDYQYYGKDNLRRICEFLDLDPNQWDDGERTND